MFQNLSKRLKGAFDVFRGERELTEANIEEGLLSVRSALLEADVHFQVSRDFVERVRERALGDQKLQDANVSASDQFVHAVHTELVELMGPEDARLNFASSGPTVILMAGLQGAGKTTTCGKLARHLAQRMQKRPLLVAADIKRPAAVEQLKVLGRKLGFPVFHEEGLTPPELCAKGVAEAERTGCDVVILDTAGRLHVDDELMAEVGEIARRTQPHNQVLVVDAMTGQDALKSAQSFHDRLSLSGVILTKMDGDARGGAAVSLKHVTGCPILFLGTGEKLEDLDPFSAERLAGRILGMGDIVGLVETAAERIDEKQAQEQFEKMVMGSFTIEDMLAQLRMIQGMGPLKKVLGMMPGLSDQMDQLDGVDDKSIKRIEALCTSMTVGERLQPELIDVSRKRRIARGAGQDISDVNKLLKSHDAMKKMMKQLDKLGLGAGMAKQAKLDGLAGMSADGQLAGNFDTGLLDKLGGAAKGLGGAAKGLGSMMGLGGGGLPGGLPPGFDPSALGLPGGPGAAGKGSSRGAAGKANRSKQKAAAKQRRKNRKRK